MKFVIALTFLSFIAAGCASNPQTDALGYAAKNHQTVSNRISLGERKASVLATLAQTQDGLPPEAKRNPKRYRKHGVNIEIYYARSGWIPDGINSDSEYTPYVFNNGFLVAIGWDAIDSANSNNDSHNPQKQRTIIDQTIVVVY